MKKIQFSVAMRGNPQKKEEPKKAYGKLQSTGTVSLDELADHIQDHNSVYSQGTIVGILTELSTCVRELLLQGYTVVLGKLGSFIPSIRTKGAATAALFTADNITQLNVKIRAGRALQNLRSDAEFERTTTRRAQAAALKAQTEGLTSADWSEDDDDDDDGEG